MVRYEAVTIRDLRDDWEKAREELEMCRTQAGYCRFAWAEEEYPNENAVRCGNARSRVPGLSGKRSKRS